MELLEKRRLFAGDGLRPLAWLDVNRSGAAELLDALMVINALNARGAGPLNDEELASDLRQVDVDDDAWLTPRDALHVINALNAYPRPPVIVASLGPASDPDGNGVVLLDHIEIVGQTAPGAVVEWGAAPTSLEAPADVSLTEHVTADAQGRFRVAFSLAPGMSVWRAATTDPLGRSAAISKTIRRGDMALDWNATLLNVIRDWTTLSNDPYTNRVVTERPPVAARNLAMIHAALFDAFAGVDPNATPLFFDLPAPEGASAIAAAAAAAHRTASAVYTATDERAVFDAALVESLATVPDGPAEELGVVYGRQVADAMLAWRSQDGAAAQVAYVPGNSPGDWNRTFPDFLPPLLPQWPDVVPFAIPAADDFLPPPPPALASADYAASVDEVLRLGGYASTERSPEQTEIALFWADGGGTFTPPGHWNQIAADVAMQRGESFAENARWMALLNLALADAGIVAWDAKYAYDLWRPIDAIRKADIDGNVATTADATWFPLLKTPPFPSYVSGHSTFSGAAAAILTARFGDQVSFTTLSDGHEGFETRPLAAGSVVARHFTSFQQAAEEAGVSRIYGGIHYAFDNTAGLSTGQAIGQFVLERFALLPAPL